MKEDLSAILDDEPRESPNLIYFSFEALYVVVLPQDIPHRAILDFLQLIN